ncbi:Transmembrane protein 87B [Spatholobus suberectus]|nr:Transmembrane protein 87B [Spatholobus suberectus]
MVRNSDVHASTRVHERARHDLIGGLYLKSNLICYDLKLAKEGNYNLDEVIIQKNPEFPKRIKTFFQGTEDKV